MKRAAHGRQDSVKSDIQRYVSSCTTCARAKASHRGEIGALKPNEPPTERMQSVSMDLMSGMPTVTHHDQPFSQIVVLVDRLSKKIFVEPLSSIVTATELATVLDRCRQPPRLQQRGWPGGAIDSFFFNDAHKQPLIALHKCAACIVLHLFA